MAGLFNGLFWVFKKHWYSWRFTRYVDFHQGFLSKNYRACTQRVAYLAHLVLDILENFFFQRDPKRKHDDPNRKVVLLGLGFRV